MHATVLALGVVVALSVAYALLSERMDYGSLARRQLDLWAFVGGLVCLSAMVYGGAGVRRASGDPADVRRALTSTELQVVERRGAVPLGSSIYQTPASDVAVVAVVGPPSDGLQLPSGDTSAPGSAASVASERPRPHGGRTPFPLVVPAVAPSQTEAAPVASRAVFTPALVADTPVASAPAVVPVVVAPTSGPTAARPTDRPPESPEPTAVPSPWLTPTPVCGDPREIDLDLDVLDASIERVDGVLAVLYRAQVLNRSTFPVRLRDLTISLEGQDSGSERFGHERLPDVQVEPSVVHAVEGTLALEKSPSPFGSTQFCVSLVVETCGRSLPYHYTKRCIAASGF